MPQVRAKRKPRRQFVRYGKCSLAELRRFLKDRTGVDFDRKTNRVKLTARLRELDRNRTFPRFNELPPELRLRVYDLLLAPDIFWPTILLRSKVVVRFEGVSGVLNSQQSEQSLQPENSQRKSQRAMLPTGTAEGLCKLVARIRHRCEAARIKASSDEAVLQTPIDHENDAISDSSLDDRFDIYKRAVGSKGICVGELVRRLAPLAEIVDTVDIASGSTRWKLLQALADDAARFEGKRSLALRSQL
jgi:hypothetical protein